MIIKEEYITKDDEWPGGISDGLTLPCSLCNVIPAFDYTVSDEIWDCIIPAKYKRGVICLMCLDGMATKKGIDIAGQIERVQFTGKQKTVVFIPNRIIYYEK